LTHRIGDLPFTSLREKSSSTALGHTLVVDMKEVEKRGYAGSIELTDWQDEKINCCQNKVLPSVLVRKK